MPGSALWCLGKHFCLLAATFLIFFHFSYEILSIFFCFELVFSVISLDLHAYSCAIQGFFACVDFPQILVNVLFLVQNYECPRWDHKFSARLIDLPIVPIISCDHLSGETQNFRSSVFCKFVSGSSMFCSLFCQPVPAYLRWLTNQRMACESNKRTTSLLSLFPFLELLFESLMMFARQQISA